MPKKSARTVNEILAGLLKKPQVPCSHSEAVRLMVAFHMAPIGAVSGLKAQLRGHVEQLHQLSSLTFLSSKASTDERSRELWDCNAACYKNAANLLNAELNRP